MSKMMRPLLFLLTVLLLAGNCCFGNDENVICHDALVTPEGKDTVIQLVEGWRYIVGDDGRWAKPEFDDGQWDTIKAALIGWAEESTIDLGTETAWFRLRVTVDSSYQERPMVLFLQQVGTSELYLDGKKLIAYGRFKSGGENEVEINPTAINPVPFEFSAGADHVIAVRHAARDMTKLLQNDKEYGFQVTIAEAKTAITDSIAIVARIKSLQIFFTSVSLAIALIHFLMFVFYPGSKENLFFSVLSIGFAGLAYLPFQVTFVSSEFAFVALFIAFKISLIVVSVSGLKMLYTFFYYKTPRLFWIVGATGGALNLMSWYFPLEVYYLAAIISMVIGLQIIATALYRKKRGASLIGLGYFIFTLGSIIQILGELQVIGRFWTIHQPYMFGILGMVIIMSIHLARDFARKSIALRNKLIEVKELSLKTIEQERKAQEQEMRQKLLENELEHQSEQLKKANELEKAHQQLEQTHYQLQTTQTQLIQSEKMASLGNLVAGVAHEINTPIGAVGSMHDTLRRAVDKIHTTVDNDCANAKCPSRPDISKYLNVIDDANKVITSGVDRVSSIVRKLRSFARLDEAELKTVDIHDGIEDTLTLIHHETKHGITIEKNFGNLPPLPCYPGQLNQVFLNLLVNACQAMNGNGEITIITRQKDDLVYITIIDRGPGISEDCIGRIFDPGYTTKGVGVGTGLGLSICYQIIKSHHGEIKVTSKRGEGTTFTIILPTELDKILEDKKGNRDSTAGN